MFFCFILKKNVIKYYDNNIWVIIMDDEAVRINKYLSRAGFCSRRAADEIVLAGRVLINGKIAVTGSKVCFEDEVTVDGKTISNNNKTCVYAFYKPVGYISSLSDEQGEGISSFLPLGKRLFPVGRLDKESEGLMLLTNDGELMNSILKAANGHEKEYIVTTKQEITQEVLSKMQKGVPITNRATGEKIITAPCKTEKIGNRKFRITLIQGLNRQIRRMCGYFNIDVVNLKRIRIVNVSVKGLKPGDLRELMDEEVNKLNEIIRE